MNELQIIKNENGNDAVLCSQLFKQLGLQTTNYKRWVNKNITNNHFAIEGKDFVFLSSKNYSISNLKSSYTYPKDNVTNKSKRNIDFVLSLDFAKCLAMLCRTKEGEAVRNYFLLCEQLAKDKETSTIQFLKNRLSIYERMEQIRTIRRNLYKQMQELKTAMTISNQAPENNNYQLTLNFN